MTAMDIKVLMPRFIFLGILIGVVITLFNMFAPEKLIVYLTDEESETILATKEYTSPDLINQIAWAETGVARNTSQVYLIDGESGITMIPIKELREIIGGYSNCFLYSRGYQDEKSFIFSVQHVTTCDIKENYYREITLKGGWKQRINKDVVTRLRKIIDENFECTPECEYCCKPPKKVLSH